MILLAFFIDCAAAQMLYGKRAFYTGRGLWVDDSQAQIDGPVSTSDRYAPDLPSCMPGIDFFPVNDAMMELDWDS